MTPVAGLQIDADQRNEIKSIVKRSGSSFYWAMRLLPPHKRDAMFAIYAFCREVDDIADGDATPATKRRGLNQWRDELSLLHNFQPRNLITRALVGPIKEFGLDPLDFEAVIDGMEMDAVKKLRLSNMAELSLYCDRVACAVGRLSNRVFGIEPNIGDPLAKSLGEALQLTNILRDVHEDSLRNHVYLPAELLTKHGITDSSVSAILGDSNLADVCADVAQVADDQFKSAQDLIDLCDPKLIRPAIIMENVYHNIFQRLSARGWHKLDQPVGPSKFQKALIVAKVSLIGK